MTIFIGGDFFFHHSQSWEGDLSLRHVEPRRFRIAVQGDDARVLGSTFSWGKAGLFSTGFLDVYPKK